MVYLIEYHIVAVIVRGGPITFVLIDTPEGHIFMLSRTHGLALIGIEGILAIQDARHFHGWKFPTMIN